MLKTKPSFTLIELLLSIGIALVVLSSASALYLMGLRAYRKAAIDRELSQNGRISVERISREIRQTGEIATIMPETEDSNLSGEIMFRNGCEGEIKYIRYYLDGDKMRRQERFYYFSGDADKNHITWNSAGSGGESPVWEIITDEIVAENFSSIGFFGNSLVKMRFLLSKSDSILNMASAVLGRNIN